MVDLPNRADLEASLARKLGRTGNSELRRLMDALGDPPLMTNIPSDFWEAMRREYESALIGTLETIFLEQVAAETAAIGIAWDIANTRAADWATQYGFDLVSRLTDTRRRLLQQSVADFNRTGMSLGDLRSRLENEFGAVRAEMIAVTETTRAAAEANREYVGYLRRQGAQMRELVQTSNDERVCPICGPKQDQDPNEVGIGYPPFHPRCRCWTVAEAILN